MSSNASRRLTDKIHSNVREMVSKSRLSRLQQKDQLVLVDRSEITVQELLGCGAFSQVHLVTTEEPHSQQSRCFAMKHIKPDLLRPSACEHENKSNDSNNSFCLAACELAIEAHLLASFNHPNIIAIRGWAANGVASFALGCRHDSFFLLLDPLKESLDQRLAAWKEERLRLHGATPSSSAVLRPRLDGFWSRWAASSLSPQQQHLHQEQEIIQQEFIDEPNLYAEKLRICTEIASALSYLHSLHVIYRDLKPNNIGFLSDGRVQLFDFGLSRELPSAGNLHEPFIMSGKVGTLRYMSPEVATHQPYTVSADVYSYSMVAYEILTLQKPFQGWTRDMHSKLVCGRHMRPDLAPLMLATTAASRPASSQLLRPLIESSWAPIPTHRTSMHMIYEQMNMIQNDSRQVAETYPVLARHQEPHSISIELPPDFEVRKAPNRSVSASTKTTVSMGASTVDNGHHYFFFG